MILKWLQVVWLPIALVIVVQICMAVAAQIAGKGVGVPLQAATYTGVLLLLAGFGGWRSQQRGFGTWGRAVAGMSVLALPVALTFAARVVSWQGDASALNVPLMGSVVALVCFLGAGFGTLGGTLRSGWLRRRAT